MCRLALQPLLTAYLSIFCIGLFITMPALKAQEVYDLKRCLAVGLEQNYAIQIAKNTAKIASNNYTLGNAGFLPTVDLSGRYSGTVNNTKQELSDGSTNNNKGVHNQTYNLGASLSWTIFNGFSVQTTYKRLGELQKLGELNVRLSVESLVSRLATEYNSYIRQRIREKNLKYAVNLSKERVRIVQERYLLGSASKLDLQQAMVDFNADSSRLMAQNQAVAASGIMLNELMGMENISKHIEVADTTIAVNSLLVEAELVEQMLSSNSSLLLAEKNKTISEMDYKLVRSRSYPYLTFGTGYGYTYNKYGAGSSKNMQTLGLSYSLTLGVNIFDGFNQRRSEKNARLAIANRELEQKSLELSLKSDLAAIYDGYSNNLELIRLERQNFLTAKDYLEIAMERYKLGDLAGIQLREAQKSFFDAEDRLLTVLYQAKLAEISLMQISGRVLEYLW